MRWFGYFLLGLTLLMPACISQPDSMSPTPAGKSTKVHSPKNVRPTITVAHIPSATPSPTEIPLESLLDNLTNSVISDLGNTASKNTEYGSAFGGINDVKLKEFPIYRGYWLLHSVGSRSYDPMQSHFISVYLIKDDQWIEWARADLNNPDHLRDDSAALHKIDNKNLFIEVKSGAGAHSGCYDLFNFDGVELDHLISSCASSPDAGWMQDLDGDGIEEAILNLSQDYVFCYACGVRIIRYQIWRWDGNQLIEVTLSELENDGEEKAVLLNNEAVRLAKADLWEDARDLIEQALALDESENQTILWNAALINLTANGREEAIASSGFPLLNSIFFGDYDAALDIMRGFRPHELFSDSSPLINGSAAEGMEKDLLDWVNTFTNKALDEKPDLAAAYFLKAWALYLNNPTAPAVLKNLDKAVMLDADDDLFSKSYLYLRTSEQGE